MVPVQTTTVIPQAHVRLRRVSKRFGSTLAVDDVSLEVAEGSFTTLLGPSGCGKTTTMRMVAGFHHPDEGEILIRDRAVTGVPAHRRNTAMVFQEYALFPHMTVGENVGYGLRMRRVPRREARRRIGEALDLVGLSGQDRKFPHQLSGGQQQRVALARALVVEPEVLLLDEPLSNLDAKLRVRVRTEIRQLQERLGKTTIYVTHDQEEALAISDQIAVMHAGRLQQVGSPSEIYLHPANRFVADFVGLANFVEGDVVDAHHVRVNAAIVVVDRPIGRGGRVTLLVRPEMIRLVPPGSARVENLLRGRVTTMAFLGSLARYWIEGDGAEWVVDVPAPGHEVLRGEVGLLLPRDRLHVLAEEQNRAT
ncbi:MAG TPA: ABC transporter ATP-binding protein [bacterium]|jgi:ABC-type Fe3+/spermidine/putrescine transport system ATPase subunit|nr:ABC transporter ATP-binding protein [bacterium]